MTKNGVTNYYRYACGKCKPCCATKIEELSLRILLEAKLWPQSWFISLTYNEDHIPLDRSLSKPEAQKFLKRLRKYTGQRIKYFICGEYGSEFLRPHYHAVIFGFEPDLYENKYGHLQSRWLDKAWDKGFHNIQMLEPRNAKYVAKYATKQYSKDEKALLGDRQPEFALYSGVGAGYMPRLAASLERDKRYYDKYDGVIHLSDLPPVVRLNGKLYPLDSYLKGKLREALGGIEPSFIQSGLRSESNFRDEFLEFQIDPKSQFDRIVASDRKGIRYFQPKPKRK